MESKPSLAFMNDRQLPVVLTPEAMGLPADGAKSFTAFLDRHRDLLSSLRLKYGAILFRGFGLSCAEDFHNIVDRYFGGVARQYVGGAHSRGKVAPNVYESTKLPAWIRIPQHNEMSYLASPPREMWFYCDIEPVRGGETPLCDSRAVYRALPSAMTEEFERKQVRYHRYNFGPKWNLFHRSLQPFVQLHGSWMDAFSTNDSAEVERVCQQLGLELTWDRQSGARLTNRLSAIAQHPATGETVWFNQAATFLLTPKANGKLRTVSYRFAYPDTATRPFHATFGTGEPIPEAYVDCINQTVDSVTVQFPWRAGDLMLVDNYLVAHGRMPFRGPRRILVAMK